MFLLRTRSLDQTERIKACEDTQMYMKGEDAWQKLSDKIANRRGTVGAFFARMESEADQIKQDNRGVFFKLFYN